jgi:hypothetical protein
LNNNRTTETRPDASTLDSTDITGKAIETTTWQD